MMKLFFMVAVWSYFLFPIANAESDVVNLTKDNFDTYVTKDGFTLVKFFAPWCGHCKSMAPAYESAASTLKEMGLNVTLAEVDATAEQELAGQHGIQGYPTLKFFDANGPHEYDGGRSAESIVEWIKKKTGPPVVMVEDVDEAIKNNRVSLIALVRSEESEMFKLFKQKADELRMVAPFYAHVHSDNKDIIKAIREEEGEAIFNGSTIEELAKFINTEKYPFLGPINKDNYRDYLDSKREIVWLASDRAVYDQNKENIRTAAKEFREDVFFVWLDTDEYHYHAESTLGLENYPALVFQSKSGRYELKECGTKIDDSKNITQFISDARAGLIERSLKSQEVPEKNDEPVTVVVGKTFESIVLQDKDVLLEVYAPWCGHCKSLEPVYVDVARHYANNDKVVIAKMDGTSNEAPVKDFEWHGFPTIFFVKAGEKKPIKYDGDRSFQNFVDFITTNGSPSEASAAAEASEKEEL